MNTSIKHPNLPAMTDDWIDDFIIHIDACIKSLTCGEKKAPPDQVREWQSSIRTCNYLKRAIEKSIFMRIEERIAP